MIIPAEFHIRMNLIFWFVDGAGQNGKIAKYWLKMKIMTIKIYAVWRNAVRVFIFNK